MMISRMNSTYNNNINSLQNSDNDSKSLQTKLMSEQRRLKAVDSDVNMDDSQKAKEKLKIQQQIDEINRKLKIEQANTEAVDKKSDVQAREAITEDVASKDSKEKNTENIDSKARSIENRDAESEDKVKTEVVKESQDTKAAKEEKSELAKQLEQEEVKEKEEESKKEKLGIGPQELHKMLSADYELQRERVLSSVSSKKEGVEDVLRAEIKSDTIQGTDTEDKKEKLSEMRKRKPIQIETLEVEKKDNGAKPKNGMKIIIKEDSIV